MIKRAFLLACIASAVSLSAVAQTFHFEPVESVVSGVLTREVGETADGKRIMFPALRLSRPITVEGDEDRRTSKGVALMHIIFLDGQAAAFTRLLGKRVDVVGSLIASETGAHQTDVLIMAKSIRPAQ